MLPFVTHPLPFVKHGRFHLTESPYTLRSMDEKAMAKRFGSRVKRLRQAWGLTAGELAERVNLSESYIRVLESGVRTGASVIATKRIADALGVTVDNLIEDGDIDEVIKRIEFLRSSRALYGETAAASEIENIQIFTSMMRDVERLNLPENVKQMLRDDIERIKREAVRRSP